MTHGPLTIGNYLLIIMGIGLIAAGPIIAVRTVRAVMRHREKNEKIHPISNGINLIIAVLLLCAGVLFVLNNLKGNPFA